ncbi:MAG: Ig-like domain-containing protein [Gammaproteobacteria bacterium]|nr:Ig-like domain-containing protein [Gammaproteobacteria bacterium]
MSGINTATAIVTGTHHSCTSLSDGTMKCWGAYPFESAVKSVVPVTVVGVDSLSAIAAGSFQNLALLQDGTLKFWGDTPVPVVGSFTSPVLAIDTMDHNLALLADGTVHYWYDTNNVNNNGIVKGIGVVWSSSDEAVATVDLDGTVHGLNNGVTTITATVGNISGSIGLSVGNVVIPSYTIGGDVSGLVGTLVLQNNGGDDLSVSANGGVVFDAALTNGSTYAVTVQAQPAGQTCVVDGGSGSVNGANVVNVHVVCANDTHTIGGVISGLSGTLVLQNNGADDLPLSANGDFIFSTPLSAGAGYSIAISQQPDGYVCAVSDGVGAMGTADIVDVTVTCLLAATNADNDEGGGGAVDFLLLSGLILSLMIRSRQFRVQAVRKCH